MDQAAAGASPADATATSTRPTRAEICAALSRLEDAERERGAVEAAGRRRQLDETRAIVRVAQLDSAANARLDSHAATVAVQQRVARVKEQLREADARFQDDKKRLANVPDKKKRHELVQQAKARREEAAEPLRATLAALEEPPHASSTAADALPRIGSAKPNFRAVMEQIEAVKRDKIDMLDPYAADLKLGHLWQSISEAGRSLECYERAVRSLTDKHIRRIPPEQLDAVLEAQRLRVRILRKQPYVEDPTLATPEEVTRSVLTTDSLGPLNDLRGRLLAELLAATPTDPYLLEAVANLHVRRHDFTRAKQLSAQLVALPSLQRLELFSSVTAVHSDDL